MEFDFDFENDSDKRIDFDELENIQQNLNIIRMGRENIMAYARKYLNKTNTLYDIADAITPIQGFEDFIIHGKPNRVEYETSNGQWIKLSAKEFADSLKNDPEYKGGNIRLLSCGSGKLDNGFAQQLANIMNVEVMAPTEILWISKSTGKLFISDSETLAEMWDNGMNVHDTGTWKTFIPQKENKNE